MFLCALPPWTIRLGESWNGRADFEFADKITQLAGRDIA